MAGRWIFHPQRWLDVGPATVDANGVDVSYGGHLLADGVHGSFGATVYPFDLRGAKSLEVLDHVSYDGRLRGRGLGADALRLLTRRSPTMSFGGWEGLFDARVVLDRGRLANETRVWSEAADCSIVVEGLVLAAMVRTRLRVDRDLATLDMLVSDLRVSRVGVEQARVAAIAVALSSRQLQVSHFGDDTRFALNADGVRLNDMEARQRYLSSLSTFAIPSGAALC